MFSFLLCQGCTEKISDDTATCRACTARLRAELADLRDGIMEEVCIKVLKERDAALLQIEAMKPVVDAAVKLDQAYPKWFDLGLKGIDIQNALEVYYLRAARAVAPLSEKQGPPK